MRPSFKIASLLIVVLALSGAAVACGAKSNQGFVPDGGYVPTPTTDSGVTTASDAGMDSANSLGSQMDTGVPLPPPPPLSSQACSACKAAGGTCSATTCTIADNPGKVPMTTQGQLTGGGTGDPRFAWLYPYDQTIFPQGLLPPTLQFDGNAPDALYVEATCSGFSYKGFYGASSPGRLVMSQNVWTALTLSAASPVTVSVTKISGGAVSGPITETWGIAHGSLRGTIYYETYNSTIATNAGGIGGVGVMRIQPGGTAPTAIRSGCGNVCHTASADGSTLVANAGNLFDYLVSSSYDLKADAGVLNAATDARFTYGGLYPDGTVAMSATNYRTWLGAASHLYNTSTGAMIPAPGWDGVIKNAGTSSFSPDGKHMAFNHEDTGGGHTLALMNFDVTNDTFSGLVDLATDPAHTLAWPAFTPDSAWVVYHAGSNSAFETDMGATGDVYMVNVSTRAVQRLNALDGYTGAGSATYLPAQDPGLSFAPTVLPEAVGGYFWVVFTSHRSYGNTLPSMDSTSGGMDDLGKLWVAAMDIPETGGEFPPAVTDPSHPAFYLDGQESNADNLRGFWVLNPCKADGTSCSTGDQCCGGYCNAADGGMTCSAMSTGCSAEYDKCTTAADCCDKTEQCIAGRCAEPTPQ